MKWRFALIAVIVMGAGGAQAKPRAVSLDYCSDQYLLKLADPEQIIAVSRGADDDYSYMRDAARSFSSIRATLEETLALKPDLVLRQWGGGANAPRSFGRFGAEVVSLGFPEDFDGVKDNIRLAAIALEQEPRGAALIAALDQKLAALKAKRQTPIRALYVTPGGVTAGAHTMIDAVMKAAGVINITAEAGKSYWPPLPAEALIMDPPQLIVTGFFKTDAERANHWSAARHPALLKMFSATPSIHLSADLVGCAAWYSLDAAEEIAGSVNGNAH